MAARFYPVSAQLRLPFMVYVWFCAERRGACLGVSSLGGRQLDKFISMAQTLVPLFIAKEIEDDQLRHWFVALKRSLDAAAAPARV